MKYPGKKKKTIKVRKMRIGKRKGNGEKQTSRTILESHEKLRIVS